MAFLCSGLYTVKITLLLLPRSWNTFHMEKPLVSWWEHRLTHDIQTAACSYTSAAFTALRGSLASCQWVLAECIPEVRYQAKPEYIDFRIISWCVFQNLYSRGMLTATPGEVLVRLCCHLCLHFASPRGLPVTRGSFLPV